MSTLEKRQLERLRYRPGQDLRSRDFRELTAVEAQLRWWHNRAEHGAYGVRFGLQAVPEPQPLPASREATAVMVSPGLAYDAFGRELVLARQTRLAVPASPATPVGPGSGPAAPGATPAAATRVLTLRYTDADPAAAGAALEPCGAPAPAAGTAELAWISTDRPRPADGVPLGKLRVEDGRLAWDLAFRQPLVAPILRPRFANGATLPGGTSWTFWTLSTGELPPFPVGLQVWIDTGAAGFTGRPCYFAWLQGKLNGDESPLIPLVDHVGSTFPSGFFVHVLPLWPFDPNGARIRDLIQVQASWLQLARRNLSVGWLGIQMPAQAVRPLPPSIEVSNGKP